MLCLYINSHFSFDMYVNIHLLPRLIRIVKRTATNTPLYKIITHQCITKCMCTRICVLVCAFTQTFCVAIFSYDARMGYSKMCYVIMVRLCEVNLHLITT